MAMYIFSEGGSGCVRFSEGGSESVMIVEDEADTEALRWRSQLCRYLQKWVVSSCLLEKATDQTRFSENSQLYKVSRDRKN